MNSSHVSHVAVLAPVAGAALALTYFMARFSTAYVLSVLPGQLARKLPTTDRVSRALMWGALFTCLLSLLVLPSLPDPWSQRTGPTLLAFTPVSWLLAVAMAVVVLCAAVAAWAFEASTWTWVAFGILATCALTAVAAAHGAVILLALDVGFIVLGLSLAAGGTPDSSAVTGSLRRAARRFLTLSVLASAACWIGLVNLSDEPLYAWLLAAGLFARAAVFPLHTAALSVQARLPTPIAMLYFGALAPSAAAVSMALLGHSPVMAVALLLAAAVSWTASLRESDLRRVAARWSVASLTTALALGLATIPPTANVLLSPSALVAAADSLALTPFALLMVATMVGSASITYLSGTIEFTLRHREIPRMGGLAARTPGIFGWTLATSFILAGAPPFASFAGRLIVLADSPGAGLGAVLAGSWVLAVACCLIVIHRVFLGIPRVDAEPIELTGRERLVLVLLCTTAVAASLSPMTLLRPPGTGGSEASPIGQAVPAPTGSD